jgi:hypothetical protein
LAIDDSGPLLLSSKKFSWQEEALLWRDAIREKGVVQIKGKKQLQLWRSMVDIEGYACCVEEKRKLISQIKRGIQAFSGSEKRHHVCCMLVASSGFGKTFFVRQLAKALGFRFLSVNITQMVSRNDILDCFDTIVTTQAQNPDKDVLVFVDEINSRLEGDHVYDAFLVPIEEGAYMRGGKVFHIAPCVWIFAGTARPTISKSESGCEGSPNKGTDFESRLSMGVVGIDDVKGLHHVRTENVYRAVAMIREEFPDVRYVSEGILELFRCMQDNVSIRDLKNFVKALKNVQYGRVLVNNVQDEALKRLGSAFDWSRWDEKKKEKKDWDKEKDGDDVEVVSSGIPEIFS